MAKHDVGHSAQRPTRAGDIEISFLSGDEEYMVTLSPESAMSLMEALRIALETDGHLPKVGTSN